MIRCFSSVFLFFLAHCFAKSKCCKRTREPIHSRRNPHGRYGITDFSSAHLASDFRQWHYTGRVISITGILAL
ncbi:hypothetical protein B0H14DRAFT_2925569 [Mycena olivaceomarginata]|nr:hypothetical protein B0H14DRAFT_2925569 [Mycena olivaceomarginata]